MKFPRVKSSGAWIPVAQQVVRQLVEGKGLPQLLSGPLNGRVRGHVAVENAPTVMGHDQKHVNNRETGVGTVKRFFVRN